jgi:DNA-binding GntR family transcriptional regulator
VLLLSRCLRRTPWDADRLRGLRDRVVRYFNERHSATVSVQSHDDLMAALRNREAHAATHCCDRPECRRRAIAWVQARSGTKAVIKPFVEAS